MVIWLGVGVDCKTPSYPASSFSLTRPPCAVRDGDLRYEIDRKTARPYFCACQERASGQTKIPVRARVKTKFQAGERLVSAGPLFR